VREYIPLSYLAEGTPGPLLSENPRWIARLYFLAFRETIIGEMLHIKRFFACENELGYPPTHYRGEFEAMPTEARCTEKSFIFW
jgi:hypothetical protein